MPVYKSDGTYILFAYINIFASEKTFFFTLKVANKILLMLFSDEPLE